MGFLTDLACIAADALGTGTIDSSLNTMAVNTALYEQRESMEREMRIQDSQRSPMMERAMDTWYYNRMTQRR